MAHDLLFGKTRRNWSASIGSDPLVWTPTAARAELDRVRGVLDSVNDDASEAGAAGKLTPAELRSWRRTYAAGVKVTGSSSLWGSNVVAARQHEQEALKWRRLISSRGTAIVGPPELGRRPEGNGLGLNVTTLALAVGGVAALGYLLSKASPLLPARNGA